MLGAVRATASGGRLLPLGRAFPGARAGGVPLARTLSSPARELDESEPSSSAKDASTGYCGGHGHRSESGTGDGGCSGHARGGEGTSDGSSSASPLSSPSSSAPRRSSRASASPPSPAPPLSPARLRSDFSHCANLIRELDPESFLWISQLPNEEKAPLLAVRALDLEIARIEPRAAKSEVLGGMRYVWWRDAVNAAYRQSPPDHPVARALSASVAAHPAMGRWRVLKLLSRREEGATRRLARQPQTIEDMHAEARDIQGNVLALGIEGVEKTEADSSAAPREGGGPADSPAPPYLSLPAVSSALSHMTLAFSAGDALRRARRDLELGRTHVPVELCDRHGVDWDRVRRGEDCPGLAAAAAELAALARKHLAEARALAPELPDAVKRQLLGAVSLECYLDALERRGYKLLSPPMLVEPPYFLLTYQLKLKWNLWRGTF